MSVPKKWHVGREANQAFIDALRACLGLDPLFATAKTELERFYKGEYPAGRADGMRVRQFDSNDRSGRIAYRDSRIIG